MQNTSDPAFKVCPMCAHAWPDRESLLDDPEVLFVGYQAHSKVPRQGLFLFLHEHEACGSTFALEALRFSDFSPLPVPTVGELQVGYPDCPGFCLDLKERRICGNPACVGVYFRHLMSFLLLRMSGDKRKPA